MFLLEVPVMVAALSVQPPVHLASCDIVAPSPALTIGTNGVPAAPEEDELHVRFMNDSEKPIRRVVFELSGGAREVDAGTFAPGVMIDHRFDVITQETGSCTVVSATFADGTKWRAR